MKSNSLFSTSGLLAIAVFLLLSVVIVAMLPPMRIDLTEDRLFTLSEGTHNIVSNLETPMEILLFYSESATDDVPQLRIFANRVQELLQEIVLASNGNLSFRVIDPDPFSEDEDLAAGLGIQTVPIAAGGEGVYFGLAIVEAVADTSIPYPARLSEVIPVIRGDQEPTLEYEFVKMITRVENPDLQVVGLITGLDVDGGFNPTLGQPTPSWMVMDLIRQLYDVRRVDLQAGEIDDDIDILFIVHPEDLSEQMLYAIDQHVLTHGKAMVFLDPNADSMIERSQFGTMVPAGISSDIPNLLASWGVSYDSERVLMDSDYALRVMMGQGGRPIAHLGMLGIQRTGMAANDVITGRLESINVSSAGAISLIEGSGTTFETLIESSNNSMLMEQDIYEDSEDPSVLYDEFDSANQRFIIAARISGSINSAFPDGPPVIEDTEAESEELESATDDAVEVEVEPDITVEATDEPAEVGTASDEEVESPVHVASSIEDVSIVLVADSDILTDRLWVQVAQFLGQRIPQPFANNGDFVVNALDNLSGGADLVSIRSRGRYSRPFTRVIALQRAADDRLRAEEAALSESLASTEETLAELSRDEEGQPILQITPQVQEEIDRVNAEILETRRQLRDVRFQLNADIEQLGANIKAINTFLIPVLLTVLMLIISFSRSRRRQHKYKIG